MILHQFRIFSVVARHLNITEASKELRLSQPGVTQQLRLLEKGYGSKLYHKNGRGIELTEEGHICLRDSGPLLLQFEKLEGRLKKLSLKRKVGTLTVGGSHGPSASFLPSLLAVFKQSHPQVQLCLRTSSSEYMELLVLNSEVEIALVANPHRSPRIAVEPYRQGRILAFVSVGHPVAKKSKLTLKEFARAPLILRQAKKGKGSVEKLVDRIEERGLKPNIVMRCESPEAVKAAVKNKMGVGILCQDIVTPDITRGDFVNIRVQELKMESQTFIIYHSERSLSAHAQEFLTLLRKWRLINKSVKCGGRKVNGEVRE